MTNSFLRNFVDLLLSGNDSIAEEVRRPLLQELASAPPFRSAQVEELILDHDYFRRPLRPEDLTFVDIATRLDHASSSSLSALATHRLLLCVYDLQAIRPPLTGDGWEAFRDFHSDRNRLLADMARPFLERHAFTQLETSAVPSAVDFDTLYSQIVETQATRFQAERKIDEKVRTSPGDVAKRRMQLVQFFGLNETKQRALLNITEVDSSAREWLKALPKPIESTVAEQLGYSIDLHACWQFYLPGSLAVANLLHYLTSRARNIFRGIGALIFTVISDNAFRLHNAALFEEPLAPGLAADQFRVMAQQLVQPMVERWGEMVWSEVSLGMQLCNTAQAIADEDLMLQLSWLGGIEDCMRLAEDIQAKIDREKIPIDKDTFREPREMCSTTHVHDDHRLVVIESGEMVFWGAPGMQVRLKPGEMILVPRQRLHGSSVLSDLCVYHQPIIPEEWLDGRLVSSPTGCIA